MNFFSKKKVNPPSEDTKSETSNHEDNTLDNAASLTLQIKIRYHDPNLRKEVINETLVDPDLQIKYLTTEYPSIPAAPGVRLYKDGTPLLPETKTLNELDIKANDEIEVRYFIRIFFRDLTLTKAAVSYWMWTGEDVGFTTKQYTEYLRQDNYELEMPPIPRFHIPGLGWLDHDNKKWYVMGVRHDDSIYIENWGRKHRCVPQHKWASADVLRAPPKPADDKTFDQYASTHQVIYKAHRSD